MSLVDSSSYGEDPSRLVPLSRCSLMYWTIITALLRVCPCVCACRHRLVPLSLLSRSRVLIIWPAPSCCIRDYPQTLNGSTVWLRFDPLIVDSMPLSEWSLIVPSPCRTCLRVMARRSLWRRRLRGWLLPTSLWGLRNTCWWLDRARLSSVPTTSSFRWVVTLTSKTPWWSTRTWTRSSTKSTPILPRYVRTSENAISEINDWWSILSLHLKYNARAQYSTLDDYFKAVHQEGLKVSSSSSSSSSSDRTSVVTSILCALVACGHTWLLPIRRWPVLVLDWILHFTCQSQDPQSRERCHAARCRDCALVRSRAVVTPKARCTALCRPRPWGRCGIQWVGCVPRDSGAARSCCLGPTPRWCNWYGAKATLWLE